MMWNIDPKKNLFLLRALTAARGGLHSQLSQNIQKMAPNILQLCPATWLQHNLQRRNCGDRFHLDLALIQRRKMASPAAIHSLPLPTVSWTRSRRVHKGQPMLVAKREWKATWVRDQSKLSGDVEEAKSSIWVVQRLGGWCLQFAPIVLLLM